LLGFLGCCDGGDGEVACRELVDERGDGEGACVLGAGGQGRLSYGLLLAFLAATVIGNLTAVFVLHFTTVWAAGYLGYYLALHRLDNGMERAIDLLPSPSCGSKFEAEQRTASIKTGAKKLLVGWTAVTALLAS
jgi:hypothetical protein